MRRCVYKNADRKPLHEGLPLPKCSYNLQGQARLFSRRVNSRGDAQSIRQISQCIFRGTSGVITGVAGLTITHVVTIIGILIVHHGPLL